MTRPATVFDKRLAGLYERRRELAGDLPLDVFDRSLAGASIHRSHTASNSPTR